MRKLVLLASHLAALAAGFGLGVYMLPILTAPEGPSTAELRAVSDAAAYNASFRRDLKGSDFVHWGEGKVSIAKTRISHEGRLAPGPDYKLYLLNGYVDTREGFLAVKKNALRIGDVKTFDGFVVDVPAGVDVTAYDTVLVWCEAFGQFITSAKYR